MVETHKVILMRHAESSMNEALSDEAKRNNYLDTALDPANKDALLTEKGIGQVKEARASLLKMGITKIYVSPMRRALQTAVELELGVPIVVVPMLREFMTFKNTFCHSVEHLQLRFPDIDFSPLQGNPWWLEQIQNPGLKAEL